MLVWFLVLAGCSCSDREVATTPRVYPPGDGKNVVVLLLDDVGVDKVGAYGGSYTAHTPRIDALASEGIRFTNAYAAPMCSPSRAVLLTGRFGRRTGIGTITERASRESALPLEAITIPEALDFAPGAPWSNAAVGKWHLAGGGYEGWAQHPNAQGFDWFAGNRGNPQYREGRRYDVWSRNLNGEIADAHTYLTTGTVDDALERLPHLSEPFFLYVSFNAPHVPLHIPPEHLLPSGPPKKATRAAKYDAMLEALDTEIGRLLDSMDPVLRSRTTFITLGDNGTSSSGIPRNRGDRKRIKGTVYEAGVRVPLIVTGPLVEEPGRVETALVHVADLMPTMADLADLPRVEGSPKVLKLGDAEVLLDGHSLLPLLAGREDPERTHVYSEYFEPNGPGPRSKDQRALRSVTHKLVRIGEVERLYRMDGWWEKADLLAADEPLSPVDQVALEDLRARLDGLTQSLVYEGR